MESLKSFFEKYTKQLSVFYSSREATQIAIILFESAGIHRTDVYSNETLQLNKKQLSFLKKALKLAESGMPVQYITGEAFFLDFIFNVNPSVLIPRPETEELVMHAVDFLNARSKEEDQPKVLDIGTGSGCIAITLDKMIPNASVTAIDVSEAAVQTAMQNAEKYVSKVHFICLDFLRNTQPINAHQWDLIISNPPYVNKCDSEMMQRNVLDFEPHIALFPQDEDVLIFYKKIAAFASSKLKVGGAVFTEIHEDYGEEVKKLFEKVGFKKIQVLDDFQGKSRILKAERI